MPAAATVNEVALRLRISPESIRRGVASGTVRALRFGRAVRIPEVEIEGLLVEGFASSAGMTRRDHHR
ncbi:helix-turn-helix domain-containing protein [Pseudonocardia sp. WMMC193]|uniref:helix-turn-helix domain-containing protein n=1 Tax=Pseudonocardia sp. WMMC193 TaxID=2911965 RepID=UPI001F2139FF|nr:helix-turn-helix domain-containing protein [Pseudonocardia sp. WMMC193]MCF7552591.1 helix-turn-helix domain-containing protein [Pseudonocardia sp. WMMC193]